MILAAINICVWRENSFGGNLTAASYHCSYQKFCGRVFHDKYQAIVMKINSNMNDQLFNCTPVQLLAIYTDHKLSFDKHVSSLCKKQALSCMR